MTAAAQLYEATAKAIKDRVEGPRPGLGMTCHHMITDLLERAGLINLEEAKRAKSAGESYQMAQRFWAMDNDPAQDGGILDATMKNNKGMILALCQPGQGPAHSVVTLGNRMVAGYNNVSSTKGQAGLNLCWFYFTHFVMDNVTYRVVDPQTAADRIKAFHP